MWFTESRPVGGCPGDHKPWVTSDLKALLNKKKTAFTAGDPAELRSVQKELKRSLKESKDAYRKKLEERLERNQTRDVWSGMRTIPGFQKKGIRSADGNVDQANELNQFFNRFDSSSPSPSGPNIPLDNNGSPSHLPEPLTPLPTSSPSPLLTPYMDPSMSPIPPTGLSFTSSQVRRELERLNQRKAAGPDGISPRVLRNCSRQLCGTLQHLFNQSLHLQRIPVLWKTSCLVPVLKKTHPVAPTIMVELFAAFMTTTSLDYSVTNLSDYDEDYDIGPTENSGMCDRSWVRSFRSHYEPPLFWIIFILGAVGNLLVVWIYSTVRNRLKTMTDVYLLNLAVADLLFLSTLPFWAMDAVSGWDFGVALCKMVSAVYRINFFSSMLLLTCISMDRYISIVQVTKAQNTKKQRLFCSKLICLGVWMVSALLALPEFIFAKVKTDLKDQSFCTLVYWNNEDNRTKILVLSIQICMGFCLPLLFMFFCYSFIIRTLLQARSFQKHKALRVIFAVVLAFVLSQLPFNALLIFEATQAANTTLTNCQTISGFNVVEQVAKSLAYTHACLNPFLYVFIGVRFRQDLLRIAKGCAGRLGYGGHSKPPVVPKRPSVMSDTDTTPALSI